MSERTGDNPGLTRFAGHVDYAASEADWWMVRAS